VATVAAVALALIVAIVAAREMAMFGWLERALLYFPSHDNVHPISAFGPGAVEVRFGERKRLHGVFAPGPARPDGSGITVVFFHGNGGNLTHRAPLIARMRAELGVGAFIIDYQGYGQSIGVPSEMATAEDAREAITYLRSQRNVDTERLVYYGESLGGAVAIQLAAEQPPLGLVVQSSFTSVADMARLHYPFLSYLLPLTQSRYESLKTITSVSAPVMLIHGESDSLVPPEHSQRLLVAANEPKRLLLIPDAGHNDVFVQGGPSLWQALRDFLSSLDGGGA